MLEDENNFGCKMRDKIYNLTPDGIKKAVRKLKNGPCVIPEEYWQDVFYMCRYQIYSRITDRVEQAIQDNCFIGLVSKLMEEDKEQL